ncbi:MAG TPA: gephyrin-like molybdotransferase Glp [Chloroflexota bacterium]|nr:gephyrin-like molybdotransferase Glp [Chloroflexota bacterium]
MLSVEEALTQLLADIVPLPVEEAPLLECLDRVLARDAVADTDLPPFANSAMDGYAVHAADTSGATGGDPRRLPVVGEVAAGDPGTTPLTHGTAVRIMTGAPVPPGADAVIPVEQTHAREGAVDLLAAVETGASIRPAGDDARAGQRVLAAGAVLRPGEIGLLASIGAARVPVHRRPRVAILSTGNELVPVEQVPGPGQIRNSNASMLAAQVLRCGALPVELGAARDSRESVHAALDAGRGCDLYLSSGGVSVGDYDVVKAVLEERGGIAFWRVNMRPGKPVAFGRIDGIPFLGLPGNPVSSFVTFELFARPLLRKLAGHRSLARQVVPVKLDEPVRGAGPRRNYVRALARWEADGWHAATTGAQESHLLRSTVAANALIVAPEGGGDMAAGAQAMALLLDWPESDT